MLSIPHKLLKKSFYGDKMVEEIELASEKETYRFPLDRAYWSKDPGHVWALNLDDGNVKVGFDHYATSIAGKILFVRVKPVGREVKQGRSFGSVESGKWVGPLRAPYSGTILEVNGELKDKPELVNDDPYGLGWIAIIKPSDIENESKHEALIPPGAKEKLKIYIEGDFEKFGG